MHLLYTPPPPPVCAAVQLDLIGISSLWVWTVALRHGSWSCNASRNVLLNMQTIHQRRSRDSALALQLPNPSACRTRAFDTIRKMGTILRSRLCDILQMLALPKQTAQQHALQRQHPLRPFDKMGYVDARGTDRRLKMQCKPVQVRG